MAELELHLEPYHAPGQRCVFLVKETHLADNGDISFICEIIDPRPEEYPDAKLEDSDLSSNGIVWIKANNIQYRFFFIALVNLSRFQKTTPLDP